MEIQAPDFSLTDVTMHLVLVRPEIPPNTGSIARLAAGVGACLHLVEPLGFRLEDKYLRRAGLDYWPAVRLSVHKSWDALAEQLPWERTWLLSSGAERFHVEADLARGSVLVLGPESTGLPRPLLHQWSERTLRLPTTGDIRSLNLAQAAAVVAYESLRQQGFAGFGRVSQ